MKFIIYTGYFIENLILHKRTYIRKINYKVENFFRVIRFMPNDVDVNTDRSKGKWGIFNF